MGHSVSEAFRGRNAKTLAIGLLLAFLVFSRLFDLGAKPYHHDESIHGVESWKYATLGKYAFDPMLHGPFLYHLEAGAMKLIGVGDTRARLPVALMGLVLPFLALGLFSSRSISFWVWTALLTLSPIVNYFSRTLIMDIPMLFLVFAFLVCVVDLYRTRDPKFLYGAFLTLALMICTKLSCIIYMFAFATFIPVWLFWDREISLSSLKISIRWFHWLIGSVLCVGLILLLYSSFGKNPEGIVRLFTKMVPYWLEQNRIQRIKGPFDYYFPILATYELPMMVAVLFSILRAVRYDRLSRLMSALALPILFVIYGLFNSKWALVQTFVSHHFHWDSPVHPVVAAGIIWAWWVLTRFHFHRGETLAAFASHWATVSLFVYSYAGEKVPWLATNLVVPWFFYLALTVPEWIGPYLHSRARKRWVTAVFCIVAGWQSYQVIHTATAASADPRERLVYTHTSVDILNLKDRIYYLAQETGENLHFRIQVLGTPAWPLYWYLRDFKSWFQNSLLMDRDPWVVVVDWTPESPEAAPLKADYNSVKLRLREWWVPDATRQTWKGLLRYYFTRETYSEVGSQNIYVYYKKELAPIWDQFTAGDKRTYAPLSNTK